MTQQSPSALFYSQAMRLIDDIKRQYLSGELKTTDEIVAAVQGFVTDYNNSAGRPLTKFEPFVEGEPPSSEKMADLWKSLETDLNVAQDHLDVVRASAVFMHNYITTELLQASRENQKAVNKLKALQLYSSAQDLNVVVLGDFFKDRNLIDESFTPAGNRVVIDNPGYLTLAPSGGVNDFTNSARVKILSTSNGFKGNNQEVLAGADNSKETTIKFQAESVRHEKESVILDSEPNTWFEYEYNYVFPGDRFNARNYNFHYINDAAGATSELVDWAIGPDNGVLKLDLEFDLNTVKKINQIVLTPFGMSENKNNPVQVTKVQISKDGTNWLNVVPSNVWVGSNTEISSLRSVESFVLGNAVWLFSEQETRYIRISIEQPEPLDANIGHLYYTRTPSTSDTSSTTDYVESATPSLDNDFETAVDNVFAKWTEKDTNNTVTVTKSSVHYHHGSSAVKLVNTAGGEDDYMYRNYSARKIQPNTEYMFSAWCYVASIDEPALNRRGLHASLVKKNNKRKFLGRTKINMTHPIGQWERHEVIFTTPREFDHITLRLYSPKGTVYWDDVRLAPTSATQNPPSTPAPVRQEGPNPPLSNPVKYYSAANVVGGGLTQRREFFEGKRWVIAVRDVSITSKVYSTAGSMVSHPFKAGGLIDRIALEADIVIPPNYPANTTWVRFYVSPDNGLTWLPIARVQDDFTGIPEVIAFNDPLPSEFRESGVYYYDSSKAVDSLRVKIEISRPYDQSSSTPVVKSYKLKMRRR